MAALRLVHAHRSEGISTNALAEALRPRLESGGRLLSYVDLEKLLERLVELDLVLADYGGHHWSPTFDGAGVANWANQLSWPGPHSKPRLGENGDWMAPQPCDEYRALFLEPAGCWCGHARADHS